jgi:hypothetical protein
LLLQCKGTRKKRPKPKETRYRERLEENQEELMVLIRNDLTLARSSRSSFLNLYIQTVRSSQQRRIVIAGAQRAELKTTSFLAFQIFQRITATDARQGTRET